MRFSISAAIVAVALAGAAGLSPSPTFAATSADSVTPPQRLLLAQNSGTRLFALLQDIQRLQEQVRHLRGRIQMLEHQIQRNSKIRQRMYQKLEQRLAALAQGGTGTTAGKQQIKNAYTAAFKKLRNGKYSAAIKAFESFVEKYPDNSYSDNAWYWLGQARYVQGDLNGAMAALQMVTSKYPESRKMSSTLFRMGVIQQTQGETSTARATFKRLIQAYPDSESAAMARQRLNEMAG